MYAFKTPRALYHSIAYHTSSYTAVWCNAYSRCVLCVVSAGTTVVTAAYVDLLLSFRVFPLFRSALWGPYSYVYRIFFLLLGGFILHLVLAYCHRASTAVVLLCRKHSTAQHSATIPPKAAKQLRADQSATTQASGQSWREPAHVVEHYYSMLSSRTCLLYTSPSPRD